MQRHLTRRDFLRTSGGALASLYVLGLAELIGEQGSQAQAAAAGFQASEGTTLRIMEWNIAEGFSGYDWHSWDIQLPNIIEQLRGQNPDIVLLNETWTRTWWFGSTTIISNQVERIAKGINLPYYMTGNTRDLKLFLDGYGWKTVGIISRYPLSNPVVHPGADGFNTLEVTASINDVPHRIFSTRFAPIHDDTARINNEEEHRQAIDLLQGFDLETPIVFGGDFNAEMTSPQFKDFVYRSGLADTYIEYQEHLADPCVDRNKGPIDHIFYRGPYKVSRMEIDCTGGSDFPSDHPWVLVELSEADTVSLMGYRSLQSLNFPERYIRPQNSLGELTEISSDLDRRDATFRIVPGLADDRYVSFESANYPNYFLRHQDYRVKLHPRSEDWLFKADATFMPIDGLADTSATSFRSFNYPARHLRHRDFHLWVETDGGDLFNDHANDATFKVVPPLIATPIQTLKSATTLGSSAVPVSLSWSGTDSEGTGTRCELQRSTDEGAYANVALATPTTTAITQSLSPNHTYRFRVRIQDSNGNWSAWRYGQAFAIDARQENGTGVSYPSGVWTRQSSASAYGGALKYARASGARSRLAFSGSNVAWVATKGPNRGMAEVWLDGAKIATVDLYSATVQERKVVFASNGLSTVDIHMLEVRVLGTKNTSSSGTRVDVDAFVVLLRSDSAVGDFSATQNPSSPWSYGYRALGESGFTLYTSHTTPWGAGIDRWSSQGATEPMVAYNGTGQTASYLTINHPPDVLNVHPGPNGEKSVVRWTAPSSGTVKIEGRFEGIDTDTSVGGTTTDVAVVHNSATTLFSANVNGFGATAPFSITRSVTAGDTIDFTVGYGSNFTHANDSTGLSATITPTR